MPKTENHDTERTTTVDETEYLDFHDDHDLHGIHFDRTPTIARFEGIPMGRVVYRTLMMYELYRVLHRMLVVACSVPLLLCPDTWEPEIRDHPIL